VFSAIAWLVTRSRSARRSGEDPARETLVLAYFLFLVLFVTCGFAVRSSRRSDRPARCDHHQARRLRAGSFSPALARISIADFIDLRAGLRSPPGFSVIGAALIAFQLVFGVRRRRPALRRVRARWRSTRSKPS
jgi:hypothetical protein